MNYRIGIIGYGGVSQALVQILDKKDHQWDQQFSIVAVSDSWRGSAFDEQGLDMAALAAMPVSESSLANLSNGSVDANNDLVVKAPWVDIVIETTFTDPNNGEPGVSHCRQALENNKHVITTNKGPVAFAGAELLALANAKKRRFLFEGSVMSGTPLISLIERCLPGSEIQAISGIFNGTSNYVLGRMEQRLSFRSALAEAQELGYAENDPSADIEGSDVALKILILANQIMGADIKYSDIHRQGISDITEQDIASAKNENCCWKLLGTCDLKGNARVEPVKLDRNHPLATIRGATNAVLVNCAYLGEFCISGPGAGREETAYALLSDLLSISNVMAL